MKELQHEGLNIQVTRNEETGMLVVDISTTGLDTKDVHPGDEVPNIRIMVNEYPIRFAPDGTIIEDYETPPYLEAER